MMAALAFVPAFAPAGGTPAKGENNMTHNLMVSFEIRDWVRQGSLIVAAIEELGQTARVFGSTWFVSSPFTAAEAASRVRDIMSTEDGLMVADLADNIAVTLNVDERTHEFMTRHWARPANNQPPVGNLPDVQSHARNEDARGVRHRVHTSQLRVLSGRGQDRSSCGRGARRIAGAGAEDLDGAGRSQTGLCDH